MISRSEGFANAFLAFLNPDKDHKGISEAPPTSSKPAAPVKALKAKRSVNRKLPDDFLDEDDIPVLNIIPNRLEGDVSEEELEEFKEVPKKTPRKRGAPQRSKNVPTPKRRGKKAEVPEEIEELEESDEDETDEESMEEKEMELNTGDSDFEVELKEAPNRRDVSSRRSARATRKSFAQLLKDEDTDESDSDDIVEVPSSPIESIEEVKSPSHNQVKEPHSGDESSKAVSKPKGKPGRPPRRQSRVPKSEPSTKSSESSEENTENTGSKQKGTKGQVPGTLHNQPTVRKRGRPPLKNNAGKNESVKEMASEVVPEIRPRSKRARQPSKRISQDSDDEPLAKSARRSRNGIPKPATVRKVAKKDVQEPSTSKQSDDEEQPIPANRQSGPNKQKVSEKKEIPNRSKRSLKPITSESNSPENSKDSQVLPQTVTSPSKRKLDEPTETSPNNANVKVPSVVAINCSRCSKSVASEQELMSHFNSVHRAEILKANQSKIKIKSISKLHSCPHCTYKTEWESSLGIHVKLSHANISKSGKTTD